MVALLSMVRHIEVQLKQQQSVGRSLITLEDIIRQTEVKFTHTNMHTAFNA